MIYNIVVANPANNITVIVLDTIKEEEYIKVSNKILSNRELNAEQVGFVKDPIMGGELRLEMMGGEFCGNALRSFGMMVAKNKEIKKGIVNVEITGSDKGLNVEVDNDNMTSKAEIPLPKCIKRIKIDESLTSYLVMFEGICHAIVENIEASYENFNYIKDSITKKFNLEALGVMFFNRQKCFITPIVYVKGTDSIIFESSCGSGSMATAIYLSESYKDGVFKCSIAQPGGIIDGEVYKINNELKKIMIGGKVELSNVTKIEV